MSVSLAAVILSILAFILILAFFRYLVHKDNRIYRGRIRNRNRQLEIMIGRQIILESGLGYGNQNQQLQHIPPRYEEAIQTSNTHESSRPASRPPSYESRIFSLQQNNETQNDQINIVV